MRIEDCYLQALQRVEKNATNGGIALDRGRFVNLFNDCQVRLVSYYLGRKNDESIRAIQRLVVFSKILNRKDTKSDRVLFSLPDDYFAFSNINGKFSKGDCNASDFQLWEVKNENVEELYNDMANEPSFDYRETFYTIGEDSVSVFTKGFVVDDVFLTYYRYPVYVDIEGYIRSDGSPSSSIDPEMDDKFVYRVLDMLANRYALNEDDAQNYQLTKDSVVSPK